MRSLSLSCPSHSVLPLPGTRFAALWRWWGCVRLLHQTCSLVFSCVHIANVFRHHGLRLQLGQWTIWDWLCIEQSQIVNQSEHGYSWDNYIQFISYISVHEPGVMCKQHISYTVYSILKSITFLRCETGTKNSDWPKEARLDFDIILTHFDIILTHISDSDAMWWLAINGVTGLITSSARLPSQISRPDQNWICMWIHYDDTPLPLFREINKLIW